MYTNVKTSSTLKFNLCLLLAFFTCSSVVSQNYEFGEISLEELQEAKHPLFPEANAAFIFRRAYSSIDKKLKSGTLRSVYTLEARKKIYTKEGFDEATITYKVSKRSKIEVEASIYQLRDGEIKKTSLNKKDLYEQKISPYRKKLSFTFPDVQEGDIIEYQINNYHTATITYPNWLFMQHIPVNYSELNFFLHKSQSFRENLTYMDTDIKRFTPKEHPKLFTKKERKLGKKGNLIRYTATNISPFEVEDWLYNPENYYDQIDVERIPLARESQTEADYINSWEKLISYHFKHHSLGDDLYGSNYLRNEILEKSQQIPREELIEWALDFVHHKFEWPLEEGLEDKVKKYSLAESFEKSQATLTQKRMHFIKILRNLGFEAYEAAGIHRATAIFTDQSYTHLNLQFTAVKHEDEWQFYSVFDPLLPVGFLPTGFYNRKALIFDSSMEEPLVPLIQPKSTMIEWKIDFKLDEVNHPEQLIHAEVSKSSNGFEAYTYRRIFRQLEDLDKYIDKIQEILKVDLLSNYRIYNEDYPKENLKENFTVQMKNAYEVVNDEIYIEPLLFLTDGSPNFLDDERKYPVEIDFAHTIRIQTKLAIPAGYQVEFIPENKVIPVLGGKADYRIRYIQHPDQVETQYILSIRHEEFSPKEYPELKALFDEIHASESNPIVLKKEHH